MQNIGAKIIELRQRKGATQKDLADFVGVGVPCVSLWESGKRLINAKYLEKIADFFNVSTDYLMGITPEELKGLTAEEQELVELIKQLNEEETAYLSKFVDFILAERKS